MLKSNDRIRHTLKNPLTDLLCLTIYAAVEKNDSREGSDVINNRRGLNLSSCLEPFWKDQVMVPIQGWRVFYVVLLYSNVVKRKFCNSTEFAVQELRIQIHFSIDN